MRRTRTKNLTDPPASHSVNAPRPADFPCESGHSQIQQEKCILVLFSYEQKWAPSTTSCTRQKHAILTMLCREAGQAPSPCRSSGQQGTDRPGLPWLMATLYPWGLCAKIPLNLLQLRSLAGPGQPSHPRHLLPHRFASQDTRASAPVTVSARAALWGSGSHPRPGGTPGAALNRPAVESVGV